MYHVVFDIYKPFIKVSISDCIWVPLSLGHYAVNASMWLASIHSKLAQLLILTY